MTMAGACRAISWRSWKVRHPAFQGWHELALDPAHHLDVSDSTTLWIGAQTSANIDSRAPSGGAANSGRRLRAFTFASGAPDPFGSSST
jgi:hypothetical protein